MASDRRQILINSILGGQSKYVNYAAEDEFLHSYNIDPDLSSGFTQSDGVITPTGIQALGSVTGPPLWFTRNISEKTGVGRIYVYCANGSTYQINVDDFTIGGTSLNLNDSNGTASGNGMAYYDNYIYYARDTTIARRGPVNGSPTLTQDYWVGTLGKAVLTNTFYPIYYNRSATPSPNSVLMPNHPMLAHSDGKLYIADVVGNQGTIHYIKTTKTTVEGDTDDGSTFNALDMPYGMYPTALESYGTDIAIALHNGNTNGSTGESPPGYSRAVLAFWDTVSPSYSLITSVEFPDPVIYALKNSNGVLYVFSGQVQQPGVRVTRFAGGYTFEQVAYIDHAYPPLAGAVDGFLNRILFGGSTTEPNPQVYDITNTTTTSIPNNSSMSGCVWAIGSKKAPVSLSLFNMMGCSSTNSSSRITAAMIAGQGGMDSLKLITGWGGTTSYGIDTSLTNTQATSTRQPSDLGGGSLTVNASSGPPSAWRSQVYRIGQKFKITKISIPFAQRFDFGDGNAGLTVGIYRDGIDSESNYVRIGDFVGSEEYKNRLVIRPVGLVCEYRFILELIFTSDANNPYPRVSLPIAIEYELISD